MMTNNLMCRCIPYILTLALLTGCAESKVETAENNTTTAPITSFEEIPGITKDEIKDIITLQTKYKSLVYGMNHTTEAFYDEETAQTMGFSSQFCNWLTNMFGIKFVPSIYPWADLLKGIEGGEIEFTGDLMPTDERKTHFLMTDAIAERTLKAFSIQGSPPLTEIINKREARFAFLKDSPIPQHVRAAVDYSFSSIFVDNFQDAYEVLKRNKVDIFLTTGIAEAGFDTKPDITSAVFIPVVYNSTSLSTHNPELAPIISAVQKALLHQGTRSHVAELYKIGNNQYRQRKLFLQLSKQELDYLREHPTIKYAAEVDNYPISFYNIYEKRWQGIAIDLLAEIKAITGLNLIINNKQDDKWSELYVMLERGEHAMITELLKTDERRGHFLWPNTAIMKDRAIFISKSNHPNINISEILNSRVGVIKDSVYLKLFRRWFPNYANVLEYESIDDIINAFERDEIDLTMGRTNQFLNITYYREYMGYKINFAFNNDFESYFGFNKNETQLCSIVDKALHLVDTDSISINWTHKAHDYRYKVIEARQPLLIGAIVLSLCVVFLALLLLQKIRNQRKQLENLVYIRNAQMNAVIDNYKGLIWSVDIFQNITTFGGQLLKKLGFEPFRFLGKNLNRDKPSEKMHLDIFQNVQKTFTDGPQDWISEAYGGIFHSSTTRLYDISGIVIGVVGSTDDVTETITLQKVLETAVKDAQIANNSKAHLLANMSHEIRTPMNAIMGIAEAQLNGQNKSLSPDVAEAFTRIYYSGGMLLQIITDLLDLSKIEADKFEITPGSYEIANLINEVVQFNRIRFDGKSIEFNLLVDENIPSLLIGDSLRIKQIVNNLLSNAFKYTHAGEVRLSFETEILDNPSNVSLIFTVSDTGQGMSPEDLDKLFDEYSRFNTTLNRNTVGTGLGMSITNNLVALMNGRIIVESEVAKGTTFTVILPQAVDGTPDVIGKELALDLEHMRFSGPAQTTGASITPTLMDYGRVLVVDDVEMNLFVAELLLKPYGLNISTVTSGEAAIELVKRGNIYDIIFMDHMMPKMDGIEATAILRKMGYKLPIVALTANILVAQDDEFLQAGMDDFLSKPIDMRMLNAILNKYIRDEHAGQDIEEDSELTQDGDTQDSVFAIDLPGLNFENGLSLFSGDMEDYVSALTSFTTNALDLLENLRNVTEDLLPQYAITIHGLKSMSGWISADVLRDTAAKLEVMAKAGDLSGVLAMNSSFLLEVDTFIKQLKAELAKKSGNI